MGVEDRLRSNELQQLQTPITPFLNHLWLLPVEEAGLDVVRELAVEVKLSVNCSELLKELLKLGKPAKRKRDSSESKFGANCRFLDAESNSAK